MRRVVIDTGAIYAFVARTDTHHEAAHAFTKALLAERGRFILADTVFAETMTLLKARLGTSIAVRVGRELRRNPLYLWMALGPDGERDTWSLFHGYRTPALTNVLIAGSQ